MKEDNLNYVGMKINCLSRAIRNVLDQRFMQYAITGQQSRVLGFLMMKSDNGVGQKEVEEEFKIKRSSVTSILQNLEKQGLIVRETISSDLRSKKINVTSKGRELHREIINNISELEKALQSSLSKEELQIFITMIEKMQKSIEVLK